MADNKQQNNNSSADINLHASVRLKNSRTFTRKQTGDRNYPTLRTGKTVNYNYGYGSLKKTVSKIYRYFQP